MFPIKHKMSVDPIYLRKKHNVSIAIPYSTGQYSFKKIIR